MTIECLIELDNRHIHLSFSDIEKLYGPDYELKIRKYLGPEKIFFVAEEKVTLVGPKGQIPNVRLMGPPRNETQVEILKSDCYTLGVNAPVRMSGDLEGTVPVDIIAENGNILHLTKGAMIPQRHAHVGTNVAEKYGLKDNDIVTVNTFGERSIDFNNTVVRLMKDRPDDVIVHIDNDEGNAAGIVSGYIGAISW